MFNWNKYPSIRLLIPFLSGILIYLYLPVKIFFPPFIIINLILVLLCLLIWYKNIFPKYQHRNIFGILLFIIFLFLGYNMAILRNPIYKPHHCSNYISKTNNYIATITAPVKQTNKYVKIITEINEISINDTTRTCHGKVLLYIKTDNISKQLNYGDKIFFFSTIQKVEPPKNPEQYNYQNYLQQNGVFHQAFIKENNWMLLENNGGNIIKQWAIYCRDYFLNLFRENQLQDEKFAVAAALILGYDDYIENELMQSYSTTGVIHIICVSGMHVGLVYIIISFLTFPLKKRKWGYVLQTIIILATIWFYSAITGLAPSIVRAATMFTIIAIARTFKRNTDIYNILALSALVLLWINPFYISNLGFILSFIAVISIIALEPIIYGIWECRWNITDKIWKLIAVSLAAQIGTFPLSMYLFHQFPNYFLISNLVAVPVSSLIIYFGIGLLILSPFHFIAIWIGKALSVLIQCLNYCIVQIEQWPFSNTSNIYISFYEMLLIYFLILLIILAILKPNIKKIRNILFVFAIFLFSICWRTAENTRQKQIVIYHHSKHFIIDFINGKNNFIFCDSTLINNKSTLNFTCKNYWTKQGLSNAHFYSLQSTNFNNPVLIKYQNHFQFFNTTISYINYDWRKQSSEKTTNTDILVIDRGSIGQIQKLTHYLNPKIIIFLASCHIKRVKEWKNECHNLNIPYIDIKDHGAFIKEL